MFYNEELNEFNLMVGVFFPTTIAFVFKKGNDLKRRDLIERFSQKDEELLDSSLI